jgi:hypothetical protein
VALENKLRTLAGKLTLIGLLACGSLPALAQGSSSTPQPVLEEGQPELRWWAGRDSSHYPNYYVVAYVSHLAEPAFRFYGTANCGQDFGFLYVGRSRIAFERKGGEYAFDTSRADVLEASRERGYFRFRLSRGERRNFCYWPLRRSPAGGLSSGDFDDAMRWLALAVADFDAAEKEFKRLTASLQPNPPPQAAPAPVQAEPAKPPPPPPPKLVLSTQPGNVGVYVDDEFKGISSGEGRLVVSNLAPGSHHLRFTVIGFKELAQSLDLAAGETKTVEAKLDPAGPKPLALAEIEEALTNGLPPKGITKLVIQYGVDFAFTKEVEQRLREKGADSDLLLAIATNQK